SSVHGFPSTGRSVASGALITLPAPSQRFCWQSCGVCVEVAVPAGVNVKPQTPIASHARALQSVSWPPQSAAVGQPTQSPLPLQTRLLLAPHFAPAVFGGFEGTPPAHRSSVQSLPSLGTSVSSVAVLVFPWPSHTIAWQSPAVCVASGVPSGTGAVPHFP